MEVEVSAGNLVVILLVFLSGLAVALGFLLGPLSRIRSIERTLRDRERQFRTVVDSSADVITLLTMELSIAYVSPSSTDVLGYRPDEWRGARIWRHIHPDDVRNAVIAIRNLLKGGVLRDLTIRVRHKDGHWAWMETTGRLIGGEEGFPKLIYLAARDVTAHKEMEENLANSERLSRSIIDLAFDPIIGTDERGTIVEFNRAAELLLGWQRNEIIGQPATALVPPEHRQREEPTIAAVLEGDLHAVSRPFETYLLSHDDRRMPVEMVIWPVTGDHHKLFMATARDTGARRETHEALIAARERAEQASRLKSEFLATMSHEIRTPMSGVIGLSELLLDTDLDPNQQRFARGIAKAGATLLQIINDILDFSKLEAGRLALTEVDFELEELLDDIVELVGVSAHSRGLELIKDFDPRLPSVVRGDPARLRQILLNLTTNSVKFTEHGNVTIKTIPAPPDPKEPSDSDRVTVIFEVTDTGIGISDEDKRRIFDAFVQADSSSTRHYGGTGLGLAICKRLATMMGGDITVDSDLGHGSTFRTIIPLRRSPQSVAIRVRHTGTDLAGLRVLVVDDNTTNRLALDHHLRTWQMLPALADNATAAIDTLHAASERGQPIDVAILDMAMPDTDGIELARRITADSHISPVHLILLSSADPVDPVTAHAAGIAATLTRPVHQGELLTCLANTMASPVGSDEVVPTRESGEPAGAHTPATPIETVPTGAVIIPNGTKRVLLAEDNEVNQQVGTAMLSRLGYRTDVAANGRDALRLTDDARSEREPYDVILMDVLMPEMDGYSATAELRRREGRGHHTPVVALTAAARDEDRRRCLAAGMDDYISKPFTQAALEKTLERWTGAATNDLGRPADAAPIDGR